MIIHLDTLTDGSHRQNWSGEIGGVDLIYPDVAASVQVRASIHRLRDLITVRGQIRSQMQRPCDRCLRPAAVALEAPLHVVIRQRTVGVAPEEGDDGELLLTVPLEEKRIDLTAQVRDSLIVELPMTIYCRDECKGICPTCGADLNEESCSCPATTDARWDTLKSLKRDE